MVGWNKWLDKKVFVETRSGKCYTGLVTDIDDSSPPLIWITLIDKYDQEVKLVHSEIILIKEDSKEVRR